MSEQSAFEIIDYEDRYKPALEDISLPWLLEYDLLEPVDLEMLADPHRFIADGGRVLLARWEGQTYCAILGLVAASPVAILMSTNMSNLGWGTLLVSLVTFALGFYVAWRMSGTEEPAPKA